jgi:hypothetical protein
VSDLPTQNPVSSDSQRVHRALRLHQVKEEAPVVEDPTTKLLGAEALNLAAVRSRATHLRANLERVLGQLQHEPHNLQWYAHSLAAQGGMAGERRRWQCTVQAVEWECQHKPATSPRGRG